MTFAELLPVAAEGGLLAIVAGIFGVLHRSAVHAHERRADDWRGAYDAERARADEATRQLATVLAAVYPRAGAS